MAKRNDILDHLHAATLHISKFHFVYVLLFTAQTIAYHASKVITPELLMRRWVATASLLVITTLFWYFARNRATSIGGYKALIYIMILADIAFASFNVYTQRGYASKAVLLFVIPILIAGVLASRSALFATALLAIAAYTTTAIMYFTLNFNEGYMAELYGEIGFYSAIFLGVATLLWTLVRKHK